jgi:hypothetical protein
MKQLESSLFFGACGNTAWPDLLSCSTHKCQNCRLLLVAMLLLLGRVSGSHKAQSCAPTNEGRYSDYAWQDCQMAGLPNDQSFFAEVCLSRGQQHIKWKCLRNQSSQRLHDPWGCGFSHGNAGWQRRREKLCLAAEFEEPSTAATLI